MSAITHISLVEFQTEGTNGVLPQVPRSTPIGTPERITTAGSSQLATLQCNTATVGNALPSSLAWRVAVISTQPTLITDAAYVQIGQGTPNATTASFLCPPGTVNYFGVTAIGERIAVLMP